MQLPRWIGVLGAAALLGGAPLPAQALDFSQTVTFGDSLTSNWLLGFPFRTALYGDDPMEAVFDRGAASGDRLTDYAIPGAQSSLLLAQLGVYAARYYAGTQGRATLFSLEIGGNDVLDRWDRLSASPPGVDPYADAVIDRLIYRIGSDLGLLWTTHGDAAFVVWTIPDITFTPRHWSDRNTTRGANFRAHLARVNTLIRLLDALPNIVVFDTATFLRTNATNPPGRLQRPVRRRDPSDRRRQCARRQRDHPPDPGQVGSEHPGLHGGRPRAAGAHSVGARRRLHRLRSARDRPSPRRPRRR